MIELLAETGYDLDEYYWEEPTDKAYELGLNAREQDGFGYYYLEHLKARNARNGIRTFNVSRFLSEYLISSESATVPQ